MKRTYGGTQLKKLINQDNWGEGWIRAENRIMSELSSNFRFQDDLWAGKKNGSALSSMMLQATPLISALQSEVSCGCGHYSLCCLKTSAKAVITKDVISKKESLDTSPAPVLQNSCRQDRYEFSGEECLIKIKIWRKKNNFFFPMEIRIMLKPITRFDHSWHRGRLKITEFLQVIQTII